MTLRGLLYFIARTMGDYNAIRRGPRATAKRIGRKAAGRVYGRLSGRLFK